MNNLQVFNNNDFEVRVIEQNGEPWFVAKDVCDILELTNPTEALKVLDGDEKMTLRISEGHSGQRGGAQFLSIINESGLYALIMRSNKPQAKAFRKWVTSEVIPSIRKHGAYMTEQTLEKALTNPDFLIQLAQQLKSEQEKNKALSEKIEEDRPKVIFADAVTASQQSILVGDLSKLIKQNGVDGVGRDRVFAILRERGFLIKQKGASWNMPTQRSMELGLFEIKERVINNPDGSSRLTRTPKVTGKGQIYFINYFLKNKNQLF